MASPAVERVRRWMPGAAVVLTLLCAMALAAVGHAGAGEAMGAALAALGLILKSGGIACLYVLASVGLGRWPAMLVKKDHWAQTVLGVGAMLWLSHMLGMLGLLSGPRGWYVGWGVVVVGLVALADQVARGSLRPESWRSPTGWVVLGLPGLVVMLAAACSPPGALWPGEAHAYDALSYHLQLPKEWVAAGSRLMPVEHNVYSYLPSAMEAAYLHIGAMTGGGATGGGNFVAGDGSGVIACQMLHAWLGVITALLVGRFVWQVSRSAVGGKAAERGLAGLCAAAGGACVLCVPWAMVVGSLPYNELAMTAMLAGGLVIAVQPEVGAWARGGAVGFLVGMACGAKPTAVFLGTPMVGFVLLGMRPRREWAGLVITGCIGGAAAVAPWLVRNWAASGNPVFPFAAGLLGADGWSAEQVGRYSDAHRFVGGAWERFGALFSTDRGAANPLWAWMFPCGLAGLIGAACSRRQGRGAVLLLIGAVVQIAAWMWLTHVQSRFLMPMVIPLAIGIGLGLVALGEGLKMRWFWVPAAAAPLSLGAASLVIFLGQRAGHPNELLVPGVPAFTGEAYAQEFGRAPAADRTAFLAGVGAPAVYTRLALEASDAVLMIGNAAPLYYLAGGSGPGAIFYQTTWDRSPLGDAVREHPEDPGEWTGAITSWISVRWGGRRGPSPGRVFVLVDVDELARLSLKDHWYDPSVTPAVVERWMKQEGTIVRAWPAGPGGTYLFRLSGAADRGNQ